MRFAFVLLPVQSTPLNRSWMRTRTPTLTIIHNWFPHFVPIDLFNQNFSKTLFVSPLHSLTYESVTLCATGFRIRFSKMEKKQRNRFFLSFFSKTIPFQFARKALHFTEERTTNEIPTKISLRDAYPIITDFHTAQFFVCVCPLTFALRFRRST